MNQDTLMTQKSNINNNLDDLSIISFVKLTNLDWFISNKRDINCNRMRLEYKEFWFFIEIDFIIKIIPCLNNFILKLNYKKITIVWLLH